MHVPRVLEVAGIRVLLIDLYGQKSNNGKDFHGKQKHTREVVLDSMENG